MQSWGTRSQFDIRDTEMEPSKSGVLGLLCAACGIDRADWESLQPLTRLKMGVRVDKPGVLRKDYQTAQPHPGDKDSSTALSSRYYLADASFLVGLEGDGELLKRLDEAVRNPHWPLALGRKSYPPSAPVGVDGGLVEGTVRQALERFPRRAVISEGRASTPRPLRLILESDTTEGSLRYDVPIASFAERRFGPRHVLTDQFCNPGAEV
jgi:CRISPR system Cascade subunit CasD